MDVPVPPLLREQRRDDGMKLEHLLGSLSIGALCVDGTCLCKFQGNISGKCRSTRKGGARPGRSSYVGEPEHHQPPLEGIVEFLCKFT